MGGEPLVAGVTEGAPPVYAERPVAIGFLVFPNVLSPFSDAGDADLAPAPRPVVEASWAKAMAGASVSSADNAMTRFMAISCSNIFGGEATNARLGSGARRGPLNGHAQK